MPNTKLGEMQFQFAEIVWHYAPLPSVLLGYYNVAKLHIQYKS